MYDCRVSQYFLTTATNPSYNERSPVNISCTATGKPDPDIVWIHEGQVKSSGVKAAHLTFGEVSKEDAGMYLCMANNSADRTEKRLKLVVNCEYVKCQTAQLLYTP